MKMIVIDLDNHQQTWSLSGHIAKGRMQNKSSLHLAARKLLSSRFPTLQILEEVSIPIRKSETLYMDFYLPLIKTCIEVHGEQHYKFIPFYHASISNFLKAKKKDQEKIEWCSKNNINHIVLPFDESIEEWEKRLKYDQNI
jgi:hypothetical protein